MKAIVMIVFLTLIAAPALSAENLMFAFSHKESKFENAVYGRWSADVKFFKNSAKNKLENNIWLKTPHDIEDVLSKSGAVASGVLAGFIFHETGHFAAASATDSIIAFKSDGLFYPQCDKNTDCQMIHAGGFAFQIITTEIMFQNGDKNEVLFGWVMFNIFNSISYVYRNETTDGYRDLKWFKNMGGNVKAAEAVILSHAFYSAYRLYKGGGEPLFKVAADSNGTFIISKDFHF